MKFSILALAAATTFTVASAVDCDLSAIAPLITSPEVTTCTADSGFSFTAPTTPTGEMLTQICASSACQTVLTAVRALNLGDCTVLGIQLETDLLNPIATGCAGGTSASSTAGSSTGSSSTVTTAPTVGSTTAPATTTSSGSTASSSTVDTPATTTTPTPTTASSASLVTMTAATSAAVVAIVAAFL